MSITRHRPSVTPCKRPKVTVDPRPDGERFDVNCRVPGCGWTYPSDKAFCALKSDAEDRARIHRADHRRAVPVVTTGRDGATSWAQCECGWGTTEAGAGERDARVEHHLDSVHGLVK